MATKMTEEQARAYWRRNLSLMVKLLVVWFIVSYGCGILLVDVEEGTVTEVSFDDPR